jgi:hypothetical protein
MQPCSSANKARLCALIFAAATAAGEESAAGTTYDQKLIMLPTTAGNATCSDGSPVGFHFREAPAGGQRGKLTIWMKGGAMCTSYEDCIMRQSQNLGSSKFWLPTHEGMAIQSINKTINPDFYDWNHAYLEYCSGDFFSGISPVPINPWPEQGKQKFVFAGLLHLDQVVDYLLETSLGGRVPEEVILMGESAGGIATFMDADFIAGKLSPETKYRAMPHGGFFGQPEKDFAEFVNNASEPTQGWSDFGYQRYVSDAEKLCIADSPPAARHECGSPFRSYPYTKTPMFIVQAAVDYEQVFEFSGAPTGVVFQNASVARYVEYQHGVQASNLKRTVVSGKKTATDGLFAPACLGHGLEQMGWLGTVRVPNGNDGPGGGHGGVPFPFPVAGVNPRVDGMWPAEAFSEWYFGRGGSARNHMHVDENDDLVTLCSCNTHVCCGPQAAGARCGPA